MADIYGQLVKAQFENAAADLSNVIGLVYYNTTANTVKWYDGTAWRTAVDLATTQTLSGKTLTAPVINSGELDNSFVDGYLDFAEESAPATPASGYGRMYATTTGKLKYINDDGITVEMGSSSGVGEKNYITNPSGVSDVAAAVPTGWANVGDVDIVVTKTAGDLPRENTTAAGLKITADSNTQSVADYVYFDFTLDDVDLNKKLKISWSQKTTGTYVAGDFAVVITTQADRTTAVATPLTTAIPAADGVFTTSFDTGSTATLSLVIRATTDMTTDGGIVISDVVVGPGIQPQGAAVGDWQSYTPTGLWVSNTTFTGKWRRVGDSMEVRFKLATSGAPTSDNCTINLPTGYTIDTTKVDADGYNRLGTAGINDGGGNYYPVNITYSTTTAVLLRTMNASSTYAYDAIVTQAVPFTFGAGDNAAGWFTVPIAEWAGSGTLNVAQNDVEYASNSTAWGTSNTTAFQYGPAGAAMNGTLVGSFTHRVRFQTPPQAGDQIVLEVSYDRIRWMPSADGSVNGLHIYSLINAAGSAACGCKLLPVSGTVTDFDVYFARYIQMESDDTGTVDWPSSNAYWRVRKSSAGAAVGFGVATDALNGLAPAGVFAAGVAGAVSLTEQTATPSDPTSGTTTRIYMKGDKLILQFNDGGTVRYKYLDMTGTGVTWVHTTTPP